MRSVAITHIIVSGEQIRLVGRRMDGDICPGHRQIIDRCNRGTPTTTSAGTVHCGDLYTQLVARGNKFPVVQLGSCEIPQKSTRTHRTVIDIEMVIAAQTIGTAEFHFYLALQSSEGMF